MEFTLLWAALLAMGAALGLARRSPDPDAGDRVLAAAITGVFVGRLAAMALTGTNPITHLGDIIVVRGGVDTVAAAAGAIVAAAWTGRSRLPASLDELALPATIGLAGWHLGCLFRSACLGTRTDVAWSVDGRHPVEIYAAVGFLAAGLVLWAAVSRATSGLAASVALGSAGLIRLATEPIRPSLGGGPVEWYLAATVIGFGVAIVLMARARHEANRRQ